MREVKVDFASAAEDVADLLDFAVLELGIQVETAQLGDEVLEVGARRA